MNFAAELQIGEQEENKYFKKKKTPFLALLSDSVSGYDDCQQDQNYSGTMLRSSGGLRLLHLKHFALSDKFLYLKG